MLSTTFSYSFIGAVMLTLALFAAAEYLPRYRNFIAAVAAIVEGIVFIMLAKVFAVVEWGSGISSELMTLLPMGGAIFAFRMAYRRLKGMPV